MALALAATPALAEPGNPSAQETSVLRIRVSPTEFLTFSLESPPLGAGSDNSSYRLWISRSSMPGRQLLSSVDPTIDGATMRLLSFHYTDDFPKGLLEVRGASGAVGEYGALFAVEEHSGAHKVTKVFEGRGRAIRWYDVDCDLNPEIIAVDQWGGKNLDRPAAYRVFALKQGVFLEAERRTSWPPQCRAE